MSTKGIDVVGSEKLTLYEYGTHIEIVRAWFDGVALIISAFALFWDVAVVYVFYIQPDNLVIKQWPSLQGLGEVSLVLFFVFVGADKALGASGEIKNPARTVPYGIMLGLFIVLVLYVGIQVVAVGVLGNACSSPSRLS